MMNMMIPSYNPILFLKTFSLDTFDGKDTLFKCLSKNSKNLSSGPFNTIYLRGEI